MLLLLLLLLLSGGVSTLGSTALALTLTYTELMSRTTRATSGQARLGVGECMAEGCFGGGLGGRGLGGRVSRGGLSALHAEGSSIGRGQAGR
jgi:hypothetical protein